MNRLLGLRSQEPNFLFFQKNSILQQLQALEIQEEELLNNIEENEKIITVKNYAIQFLELLKDYKLKTRKDTILNIINTALKDIFDDAIYIDIEQEVSKSGAIKYNIVFYQQGIPIAKNDELLDSNGGGILAVISILFKILIGYLYSKNRLYIFDESFAQVSPQYRERLSLFLRQFAEKYNFTIILVSQTSDLNTYAHIEYNVNYKYDDKGIKELYIENIRENRDEVKNKLDLYELEIKNFQSIKYAKFIYQGFTVISGPNNCGKSASLRALKSILFNDFKDKYQRINTKVTEIILKRITKEKELVIKLTYKSKKVIFELDGEQYLGKNLAADVLKNYIEKNFGLKFIDIKSLYKNIKGDLRKQVENIAYNSQHDSLFLIGSKSNEIEKVFNFLFNTETITMAIAQLKEEIYDINDILKTQKENLEKLKKEISDLNFELEFVDTLYKIKIIEQVEKDLNSLNNFKRQFSILKTELSQIQEYKENFEKYSGWINYFNVYFQNIKLFNKNDLNIQNSKNKLIQIQNEIEKLNIRIKYFNILKTYFDLYNQYLFTENEKSKILQFDFDKTKELEKEFLNYQNLKNSIEYLLNLQKQFNSNKQLIDQLKNNLEIIKNEQEQEFNNLRIIKCSCCNGLGFHIKENK